MKKTFLFICLLMGFTQFVSAQSRWKFGLGLNNGISLVDRQSRSNALNSRKTVPTSAAYYNQFKLYGLKQFKSGKGFSVFAVSHRTYAYKSSVYDSRLEITEGQAPVLSDAKYRYHSFNLSYGYNRYFKNFKHGKLFAGAGVELSYNYKNTIELDLKDGEQKVSNTGSRINENYFINNIPTVMLKCGAEFNMKRLEGLQVSIIYKKDLHYFISSSIPVFSSYAISLDIPF